MPLFKVETEFKFEGAFIINAKTNAEAKEMVEKHCGLVLGGDIHTSLDDEIVYTWDFRAHPEKTIVSITKMKK